jgi:hypothetical protein
MAGKRGKKGHKKGKKKDAMSAAISSGLKRGFQTGSKKSNKRPLKLLKWARDRMKTNLPKLEKLIEQRQAGGER